MKFMESDMKKIIILFFGVSVLFFSGCVCTKNQCSVGNTDDFVKIGWAKQEAICPAGAPVRPDTAAPRQVVSLFLKPVT